MPVHRSTSPSPRQRRRVPMGLRLEPLEDRLLPSVTPQLLKDINLQTGSSSPGDFVAVGGLVYFAANDGIHGRELWKSDGTVAGTQLVMDIGVSRNGSYPSNLTNANGTLFFTAGNGLWKSDGTVAGTQLVMEIRSDGDHAVYPAHLTNVSGTLFFSASNSVHGTELWKTNGTAAGTAIVKDINPGSTGSNPAYLTNLGGTLFFSANDSSDGTELWRSDGSAAGTLLVTNIALGSFS